MGARVLVAGVGMVPFATPSRSEPCAAVVTLYEKVS
jgi:hypothetical protein